ncbi:MAG TPA: hypothetical protein VES95_10275 [Dermatophilaceae bacterium]|nr:hypothetical protein [Dermatophilaceae bacterium]
MTWLDALGWGGSALLVYSLLQSRVLRFRVLNLVASVVLTFFNAALGVWPMATVNAVLAAVNVWFVVRLLRERGDEDAYTVLEVGEQDRYLRHFLEVEGADISRHFPRFEAAPRTPGRTAYLIERGRETVGVVLVRDVGDRTAQVDLDYVTPAYRDFTPGAYVYRRSGLFRDRGFARVLTPPGMRSPYYRRLGFTPEGDRWRLDLA